MIGESIILIECWIQIHQESQTITSHLDGTMIEESPLDHHQGETIEKETTIEIDTTEAEDRHQEDQETIGIEDQDRDRHKSTRETKEEERMKRDSHQNKMAVSDLTHLQKRKINIKLFWQRLHR